MAGIEERIDDCGGMLQSDYIRTGFISGATFRNKPVQYSVVDGLAVIGSFLAVNNWLADITLFDKIFQPTLIAAGFAAILLGTVSGEGRGGLLESDSLFFLSRISYPLYLIYLPLIPLALTISGVNAGFVSFLAVFGVMSLLAGLFIHYAVEKPFLIVKARV